MIGRKDLNKPISIERVRGVITSLLALALLVPCAASVGGCESTGATVALTAGVAAGSVVGATVLTQSEVTVTVEVFVPPANTNDKFEIPHGPTLRQSAENSSASLVQIADALKGSEAELRDLAKRMAGVGVVLNGLIGDATADTKATMDTLSSYEKNLSASADAIAQFRETVAKLTRLEAEPHEAGRLGDGTHEADSVLLGTRQLSVVQLKEVRSLLSERGSIPGPYVDYVEAQANAALVRFATQAYRKASGDTQQAPQAWTQAIQGAVGAERQAWNTGDRMRDPTLRLLMAGLYALKVELAKAGSQDATNTLALLDANYATSADSKALWDGLGNFLDNAGLLPKSSGVTGDRLPAAWTKLPNMAGNETLIQEAIAALRSGASLPSIDMETAIKVANQRREAILRLTYSALLVDFNIGPISNEVVQGLLTSEAIDVVTDPDNAGQWRPFAHATSRGMAGNHDAVIYFENLATPILKKATLDPSKFQVAYGQMFSRAFSTLADVYGVPLGETSDTPSDTNLTTARAAAAKSTERAAKDTTVVLDAIEALIAIDEKLASGDGTVQAQAVKDLASSLERIKKTLEDKPPAK